MRYTMVVSTILLLVIAANASAFQPTITCPKLPQDPVKAQILAGDLFAEAEQKYLASQPLEALEGFLCSHHIIQHENTLFNIAQIAKVSKLKERALGVLKDYVRNVSRKTKTDPIRDIIAEIEAEEATIEAKPAASMAPPSPAEQPVSTDAPAFTSGEESNAPTTPRSKTPKIISFVLIGTGGATLIAGGVLQGLAGGAQEQAENTDKYSVFKSENDKMVRFQKIAIAGFAAGSTLLSAGLAVFVISNKKEKKERASLTLSPSANGLFIGGTF